MSAISTAKHPSGAPSSAQDTAKNVLRYTRDTEKVTSGWLVKEGKAMKMHKPRFLILTGSELSNSKAEGEKPTWTVSIKDCAVGPGPRKLELVVNLPSRKVSFFAASHDEYDRWIISLKKASASNFNLDAFYKVGDVIGEGINGEVHIGWDRITNEPVAIKSIPYEGDFKVTLDPEAEAEIEIVKNIHHPYLVKTYDIFRDGDKKKVYMVMEYVPGGELFARVANDGGSLVKEGDAIRIARDLLSGVMYLHSLNIVHRDIKLENILCTSEDRTKPIHIKLADFGLSSKLTGKEQSLQSLVGTSFYLAPEIITKQGYGSSVDAWAIGVVFYIVVSIWSFHPGVKSFNTELSRRLILALVTSDFGFIPDTVVFSLYRLSCLASSRSQVTLMRCITKMLSSRS
jgi:serine/threonine protein kinase